MILSLLKVRNNIGVVVCRWNCCKQFN